ncbi:MAG: endonuclease [Chloroflexota bacterium]
MSDPQPRSSARLNRYGQIIERIFLDRYTEGERELTFERIDIEHVASDLGIVLPKNLGDLLYSFRYRTPLPQSIQDRAPSGERWIIRPVGRGRYRFVATARALILPNTMLAEIKVPDSTPGVIAKYALSDEQALLAKLRYNRLVDTFTGVTCYSLQSHLRTAVRDMGQVETDEVYVGLDRRGAHFVFPVQAKGGSDTLNIVQIEQDFAMCAAKFPGLLCRPIAAQFMAGEVIALFEFVMDEGEVKLSMERHYRLVPPDAVSEADLAAYRERS